MFLRYVTKQLLPTFRKVYGNKKMVLYLDNAPYHHTHTGSQLNLNSYNKVKQGKDGEPSLLDVARNYLGAGGAVKIRRGESIHTYTMEQCEGKAPAGPSVDELRAAVELLVKKHEPHRLKSDLEVIFKIVVMN